MKAILKIWPAILLLSTAAWSQASPDSTAEKTRLLADTAAVRLSGNAAGDSAAADSARLGPGLSGHGRRKGSQTTADSLQAKGRKKVTDKFIDADGDGICDGREAGLGFQHGKGGGINAGGDKGGHGRQRQGRGRK